MEQMTMCTAERFMRWASSLMRNETEAAISRPEDRPALSLRSLSRSSISSSKVISDLLLPRVLAIAALAGGARFEATINDGVSTSGAQVDPSLPSIERSMTVVRDRRSAFGVESRRVQSVPSWS